ncbi:MAG: hypothetical protein L3J50_06345 [Emcibacter sp.]|nr:hypothetical protein [Emcibacter sp.]
MALKKSHKLRLIMTRTILVIVFIAFVGEATGYSVISYFDIINFSIFLAGSGIILYFICPPKKILENHKIINLPLKMPYKTRRIILIIVFLVFLMALAEKYSIFNIFNLTEILNFNAILITCGIVTLLVHPTMDELREETRKYRRPKSLRPSNAMVGTTMNIIAVPVTREALDRLEYDECVEGDLIEHAFDDEASAKLFDTGVFIDINSALNMIVGWNENAEIIGPKKLSLARKIVANYIRNYPDIPSLQLLYSQIAKAEKYQTGIFLYF